MLEYPKDEILIKSVRDGLVDEVHSGFVVFADACGFKDIKGEAGDYPFYMRSCAKPLQAALLIDYGMDRYFDMTEEEIALCSASHAGEKVHTRVIEGLLKKIGLDESYLKCGLHEPLSKTRQKEILINNYNDCTLTPALSQRERESLLTSFARRTMTGEGAVTLSPIHNNCSGKHTMMLGLCKLKGWDLDTYYKREHPLQIAIKNKIYELCEVEKDYPMTTDGCGVPIVSMPLRNMLRGYLNLFCSEKYTKIRDAFLNHPYLIGGEDRTDTKVMEHSLSEGEGFLIAKVGAGGLCAVVNVKQDAAFIVKVTDCDMKSRELVVFEIINRLGWSDFKPDTSIKTLHGDVIGHFSMDF